MTSNQVELKSREYEALILWISDMMYACPDKSEERYNELKTLAEQARQEYQDFGIKYKGSVPGNRPGMRR